MTEQNKRNDSAEIMQEEAIKEFKKLNKKMKQKFNLSEKIADSSYYSHSIEVIELIDIKEFIRRLKKSLNLDEENKKIIDALIGDKLKDEIKQPQEKEE